MFSQYYITVNPDEYIWDAYGDGSVCTLLILGSSYDFFLLGQPIYHGYYTIHNMTSSTIAYVPLNDSGKLALERAEIPDLVLQASEPPTFIE